MKLFLSILALPALIFPALASPMPAPATDLETRAAVGARVQILNGLLVDISALETSIDVTLSTIDDDSTKKEKKAAEVSIVADLSDLIDEVKEATKLLKNVDASKVVAGVRVEKLVEELVEEVGNTLSDVIDVLGNTAALKEITDSLLKSVLNLVKPLTKLVDGLLEDVTDILDDILGDVLDNIGGLLDDLLGSLGLN